MVKHTSLPAFLTREQLRECERLYPNRAAIRDTVISPNMIEINRKLGQENDPEYLAWAVMYVFGALEKPKKS